MSWRQMCVYIIAQYADHQEFPAVEPLRRRVENSTLTLKSVAEGEGCYVWLASALSKCFSPGVLVCGSQIVAVMEHTSQSHALWMRLSSDSRCRRSTKIN